MDEEYERGFRAALDLFEALISKMVKWDHSSHGVYCTYDVSASSVRRLIDHLGIVPSVEEAFDQWCKDREEYL